MNPLDSQPIVWNLHTNRLMQPATGSKGRINI